MDIFSNSSKKRIPKIMKNKVGKIDEFSRLARKIESVPYLAKNAEFVYNTATTICYDLGLSEEKVISTITAARLCNIGLADFYLMKKNMFPSEIEKIEKEVERDHLQKGADMVKGLSAEFPDIQNIVLCHHENYDGSGPRGKAGYETPLESQIIRVTDYFFGLVHDEQERTALSYDEGITLVDKKAGKLFDPVIVCALVNIKNVCTTDTLGALRTGNFNYRPALSNYLRNAKEFIKQNPNCHYSEVQSHLVNTFRVSENNAKLVGAFSFNRHSKSKDKANIHTYKTLQPENIINERKVGKYKREFDVHQNFNDIKYDDFIVHDNDLWRALLIKNQFVQIGR